MSALILSPASRSILRGQAHDLSPVVMIGEAGLTPAVLKEIDASLNAHGLIKIRVFGDDRDERTAYLEQICEQLNAAAVQQIGKLLVVWREMPEPVEKEIDFSRAPKQVKVFKPSKSPGRRGKMHTLTVNANQRVTAGGMIKRAKKRLSSVKRTVAD